MKKLLSLRVLVSIVGLFVGACDVPDPVEPLQQALVNPPGFVACSNFNATVPLHYVRVLLNTGACWEVNVNAQPSFLLRLQTLGTFDTSTLYVVQAKSRTTYMTAWYGMENFNDPLYNGSYYCPWSECVSDAWMGNGNLLQGAVVGNHGAYPIYHPSSAYFYSP